MLCAQEIEELKDLDGHLQVTFNANYAKSRRNGARIFS